MRRLFSPLLISSLVVSISSTVISCRYETLNMGPIGTRTLIITDAGPVGDHAFNQQIYGAIQDYSNRPATANGGGFDFANLGLSAASNWIQPLKSDYESYVNSYKLAKYKGTDIYVLNGFQHEMSRRIASEIAGKDKTIIIVDSAVLSGEKNVIPLSYSSQLAGFAAAYDSAVWATTVNPQTKKMQGQVYQEKDHISFGAYGGISNKSSTGSYLWGFFVGMAYFNARVKEEGQDARELYLANFGTKGRLEGLKHIAGTDTRFFTGSFGVGGANQAGTNEVLGPNSGKADVIFPVAGAQIIDTLTSNNRAYIIGVDVNQGIQYNQYESRFITSAIKDFQTSLFDAFDHSKANRLNHQIIDGALGPLVDTGPAQGNFWDGDSQRLPNSAWSHDLDQTITDVGTKIPHSLLDFGGKDKDLADKLVSFFNATGPESQDFLNWEGNLGIAEVVNQLLAIKQLPLTFPIS